jgi:hypothetical protein
MNSLWKYLWVTYGWVFGQYETPYWQCMVWRNDEKFFRESRRAQDPPQLQIGATFAKSQIKRDIQLVLYWAPHKSLPGGRSTVFRPEASNTSRFKCAPSQLQDTSRRYCNWKTITTLDDHNHLTGLEKWGCRGNRSLHVYRNDELRAKIQLSTWRFQPPVFGDQYSRPASDPWILSHWHVDHTRKHHTHRRKLGITSRPGRLRQSPLSAHSFCCRETDGSIRVKQWEVQPRKKNYFFPSSLDLLGNNVGMPPK